MAGIDATNQGINIKEYNPFLIRSVVRNFEEANRCSENNI